MPDKSKLLLVDDEDTLRLLIRSELEDRGFDVEEAENGEIALQKLHDNTYNLVILDIRMPGIDGMEVLKKIREDNLADKVIMLTGVDELKIARDSLHLGANDFLTKPYEIKTLLACIARVLNE
ncbi:MAG: response regulator [Bacteroidota bacterium]|nr:response regulator [Bacteroidota bacterium]